MSKRLTIMYRAGITTERASQLISADDASIVCWDDVFAERDALAQRCRELEAELEKAHKATNDECMDWAREYERRKQVQEERDALRAEVDRLQRELATAHNDASHYASTASDLRAERDQLERIARHLVRAYIVDDQAYDPQAAAELAIARLLEQHK